MLVETRSSACLRALLVATVTLGGVTAGCSLGSDDATTGDVEVVLVGDLPNTPFANALAPHLATATITEEAAHPGRSPVFLNADAVGHLTGTEKIAIQTNYRHGRSIVLLNATQHHVDILAEVLGNPGGLELFVSADDAGRSPAVALELEPDGRVQYVLHSDPGDAFLGDTVSLFLEWLDEDGARIGERLYNENIEPEHGPLTDISKIPSKAELKSHAEHAQSTRQFVGPSGTLSVTTTSLTAYCCQTESYHFMVVTHLDGSWAHDDLPGDELELIQLSGDLSGGQLSLEPLVPSTHDATTCGFDFMLDAGATFVLNDNRGSQVFAPTVTHIADWSVQETDVPMGAGEAGSHLWTLNRMGTPPGAFSYTTGWKWRFPVTAINAQRNIQVPLGARISDDQREFTLTLTGPDPSICR